MKRMIRRTIVVEYESDLSVEDEQLGKIEVRIDGACPPFAEYTETVEEITEDSHMPPAGVSRRVE